MISIELKDLPKVSLNQWYSGKHWSVRQKTKNIYKYAVKAQCKRVFSKDESYIVYYDFTFKKNPLDASNCVAMLKLIEDIIFEDDKHDIIELGGIRSSKGTEDVVIIKIHIKDNNE